MCPRSDYVHRPLRFELVRIEELMRDGVLPFRIVGGARVIAIEDLDKYFESIPKRNGKLPGRGRFLESAAA